MWIAQSIGLLAFAVILASSLVAWHQNRSKDAEKQTSFRGLVSVALALALVLAGGIYLLVVTAAR